jgi:hypothetical protein
VSISADSTSTLISAMIFTTSINSPGLSAVSMQSKLEKGGKNTQRLIQNINLLSQLQPKEDRTYVEILIFPQNKKKCFILLKIEGYINLLSPLMVEQKNFNC